MANTVCSSCGSNCDKCGSAGICTVCASGFLRDIDNTCVSSCQDGSYSNGTHCHACDAACATCTGPDLGDCTSCASNRNFGNFSGVCQNTDEVTCNTLQGSRNYYISSAVCTACDSSCKTCFGGGANECSTCYGTNVTAAYGCYASCPEGFFPGVAAGKDRCYQCPASCATCSDPNACTECKDGKYLVDGVCHDICPSPTAHGRGA